MKAYYISVLILCLASIPTQAERWTDPYFRMCVNYFIQEAEMDLEVDLPIAERREKDEKVISIHQDGKIKMDKKAYTLDSLQIELGKLVKLNKNQPIRVRGDANTDYEHIVRVIDRCRKAGVWNISFATGVPKPK